MSEKKDGGPAFPVRVITSTAIGDHVSELPGLSLRDYFAAKALQGLLACPNNTRVDGLSTRDSVSKVAYILADCMIEARDA